MAPFDIRTGNPLKAKLATGGTLVGSFIRSASVEVVEICAHAGCDFVIIDTEHTPVGWDRTAAMLIAAEAAGTVPILRVPTAGRDLLTRGLDAGALGVMVPQVHDPGTAAGVVAACRYGPDGTRGSAMNRFSGFGLRMTPDEYVEAANKAVFVSVQIESRQAVGSVEEIASIPGLDCVFVGTSDLSTNLGVPGQWDHPLVTDQIARVAKACANAGIIWGVPTSSVERAHDYQREGARFLAAGDVGLLAAAARRWVDEVTSFSA